MHASQVIRSRASLPPAAPAQQYDSSPSPSPERIARLPRVSFDLSKNRRRARISVEPRNPTTSSVRRHHEVDMDEEMPELPLPLPLPSSRATSPESGLADPQIGKSSKAPVGRSSSAHNRVAGLTSAIPKRTRSPMTPVKASKVRPRNSSGLPPPSGPDYTAPVPTLGANVDKAQLRPFDNSRLKRPRTSTTRDENSPRAEKRVREDKREGLGGESQENSQESYHGVITRRVEKRKVR